MRIIRRTRELTIEQAQANKDADIYEATQTRDEAERDLQDAIERPLKMTEQYDEEVKLGHPEYDKGQEAYCRAEMAGSWQFKTQQP